MNGNSPFIQDSSNGLFFFFMLLAVIGIIVMSFRKNKAWGVASLILSASGGYLFFANPAAEKYISAGFAVFLLIGMGQWLKEKVSEN